MAADGLVIRAQDLKADESTVTGMLLFMVSRIIRIKKTTTREIHPPVPLIPSIWIRPLAKRLLFMPEITPIYNKPVFL